MTCIVECDWPEADGMVFGEFLNYKDAQQRVDDLRAGRINMRDVMEPKP